MCNCISVINGKLEEKNLNTKIKVPFVLGSDMTLGAGTTSVETEKADKAVRKKPVPVFASYCPFCGESYKAA